ncbi:extracellular solute-binding protein [Streptomyces sp. UP1A-1]|nr:extracellular solute-binding protein [Streptomyces sp. UP1A-1]
MFAKGSVAQIVAVPGLAQTILKENPGLQGKLGFFPVPGKTAGRSGAVFTGGSDLVVPKNTDEHDGALAVVEALAGTEWNTELARTMNYVPNKESLADAVAGEEGWPRWRPAPPGDGRPPVRPGGARSRRTTRSRST